jgi:tetraacyldisaccharide 4'-kinase
MNRTALAPLIPLYATAVAAKNTAYNRGWLHSRMLTEPVISAGNLSTGGAGKTPFVIYLARRLQQEGLRVDVLSRGYGRGKSATVERVDPNGTAAQYGDEPLLIARSTSAPVYVGTQRFEAGLLAEAEAGGEERVHLLDDGFQHRQLARAADIVLLHADDFNDRLLPAGNLREPLSSLKRAQITVLRREHIEHAARVQQLTGSAPWILRRSLRLESPGSRPLVFCGLARPHEFFRDLSALGVIPAAEIAFPDHHRYTAADMKRLLEEARKHGADSLITTEKDEVKLPAAMTESLEHSGKLAVASLALSLEDEARRIGELIALLA